MRACRQTVDGAEEPTTVAEAGSSQGPEKPKGRLGKRKQIKGDGEDKEAADLDDRGKKKKKTWEIMRKKRRQTNAEEDEA